MLSNEHSKHPMNMLSSPHGADFALIKACLCAVGVMIGVSVPKRNRKSVLPDQLSYSLRHGFALWEIFRF